MPAVVRRLFSHHWQRMSLGITGRLTLSFAVVAILAITANLIAESMLKVVKSTHTDRGETYRAAPAAAPVASTTPVSSQLPVQLEASMPYDAPLLLAAVDRFRRAAKERESIDSPSTEGEIQAATRNLSKLTQELPASAAHPAIEIHDFERATSNRIELADHRRRLVDSYTAHAEAMEQRLQKSLDRAIKIFGRVLARQSLLLLQGNLDDIRRRFAQLSVPDGGDTFNNDAMLEKEATFAAAFSNKRAGFVRSEGEPWVTGMQADFTQLVAVRAAIIEIDTRARVGATLLASAHDRLVETITRLKNAPRPRHAATVMSPTLAPVPALTVNMAPHLPALVSPIVDTVTTSSTKINDTRRRTMVAWVTAAVLCILLLVSLLTVRSIVLPVGRLLEATERLAGGDVEIRVPRGGIKELDTLAVAFNRMAGQLAAARDMTRDYQQHLEEKVDERTRQLQYHAEHDPLTQLPNRRQLFVLLNHSLQRAVQAKRFVGVFFMDVDNFKNLNDGMGHAFGDRVLTGIAQRLKDSAEQIGFASRLGGDEFTVVHEDAGSAEIIIEAGRRLVEAFAVPLDIDGRDVTVSISAGASVFPDHGTRAEDLLSAADAALYQAKALGRSQLAVFTPELLATATRKFTLEQGLRRAIERNEFELVFQPEVSLDNFKMALVETLLRWRLPDGRQAPPGEFLAVTEESGLIIEVGNWVLRKAIETASGWHRGAWPEARIAINVSPRQLLDPNFVDNVQNLLREFSLPARCLELELTESVLQTGPTTIDALRRLRACDIAIALDDFGTGYSSLASLEHLPLSRIKLDRSLIASIDSSPRSAAITKALIGICEALKLDMTAEGIERPEQFASLVNHRGIYLQGYLISRPVAAVEVLLLKDRIPHIMQDLLLSIPTAHRPSRPTLTTLSSDPAAASG